MGTKANTTTLRRRRLLFNLTAALALTGTAQAQTHAVHRTVLGLGTGVRSLTTEDFTDTVVTDAAANADASARSDKPFLPEADAYLIGTGPGYITPPVAPAVSASNIYTYVGPGTGTTNLFSTAANWSPSGPPVSSASTSLIFPAFDANNYTLNNDIGNPFLLNNATLLSFSTSNVSVNNAAGNQLELTGASPSVTFAGPGNFGGVGNGGNGLLLAPTSGTTLFNGSGSGSVLFSGVISGAGGLDINITGSGSQNANGNVRLFGASTFTGNVVLDAGGLAIGNALALGAAANTLTINGGTLSSTNTFTIANPVILNADLVYNALNLTLTGPVSGAGGLQLLNGSTFSQSSTLTLAGANTFTGAVTIQNGVPRSTTQATMLTLAAGSALTGSAGPITLGDNGTLALAGNNVHVPNSNPIVFNGGRLAVAGVANSGLSETFGGVSGNGLGVITLTAGASSNTLAFGAYAPAANSTLIVRGPFDGSTSKLTFASGLANVSDPQAPGGANTGQYAGVVPFAAGTTSSTSTILSSFVHYDPTAGVTYIASTDQTQVLQIPASGAVDANAKSKNVNLLSSTGTTAITVSGAQRINALSNSATANLTGTGTLTVASGAVVTGPISLTFNGPTLDFGAATGYLHLGGSVTVTGTSGITGSGGVVISGLDAPTSGNGSGGNNFAVTFASAQTGAAASPDNPFTGGLTVNGNAGVTFYRDTQLGAAGGAVNLNGGGLFLNAVTGTANPATVNRPLNIGAAGGNLNASAVAGTVLTVSGAVTGAGALSIGNPSNVPAGPVALTGDTSGFSGPIDVLPLGVLNAASDAGLGSTSSPLNLAGGTLQFTAGGTFSKPVVQLGLNQSTLNTGANSATLATPLAGASISTSGGLVKLGTGILTLGGGASAYAGPLFVGQGTLALGGNAALNQVTSLQARAGTLATPLGGTIAGSGSVGGTINILPAVTTAGVNYPGGTLNPGDPAVPNSTGILSARRLTLGLGATFVVDLNGTTLGSLYDDVTASNLVTLGGSTLQVNVGFAPQNGQTFTIINNTGGSAVAGTFANLAEGATITSGNNTFTISYAGGDGNDVVLTDTNASAVPEPGTTARMLIGGAALLAGAAWRRLRRA